MALLRCEKHGQPKGRKNIYVKAVQPLNYPDAASICGRDNCESPGMVWLDSHEWLAYQKGHRIFEFPSAAMKVKVQ